jgi:hypothetical protein
MEDMRGIFCKKDEVVPIARLTTGEQQTYFESLIDAVLHHLVPTLLEKLMQRLEAGQTVVVGPCTLSSAGVAFRTGLIFQKDHLLPWQDVDTQMGSGHISVSSRTNRNAQVPMAARDTDNAVILPILCAAMCERTATEELQHGQQLAKYQISRASFNKRAFLGWMVAPAVIAIIIIVSSFTSTKTTSDTPRLSPPAPAYSPALTPSTPASESKTVYRVPSNIMAELDRDSQVIDSERATAERMAEQLEGLEREIKQKEAHLDQTSQSDVDEFNRKVTAYNSLLERVRAQNLLVNQLIKSYNEKLRNNSL